MTFTSTQRLPKTFAASQVSEESGASLLRLFPTLTLQGFGPFVSLDEYDLEPEATLPTHPPRGFESVTFVLDGAHEQRDAQGNRAVTAAGGVQQLRTGIRASVTESPAPGSRNRGLKLWLEMPEGVGTTESYMNEVHAKALPVRHNGGVTVRTVVGSRSPLAAMTPLTWEDVVLEGGARFGAAIPEGWQGFVYVVDGSVKVGLSEVHAGSAAFPGEGDFDIEASAGARVAVIAAQPLG